MSDPHPVAPPGQYVLCWLATADLNGHPNVSPKEMFWWEDATTLLIAHLASPVSVANIRANPHVCVSMVDIFVQKGFKYKGTASVIAREDPRFEAKRQFLADRFGDQWPIRAVLEVVVTHTAPILAPSYLFVPGTTEASQIASAMATYGVKPA